MLDRPPAILPRIESDADAAVGRAFVALAAEYFARTRNRDGRVSTPHTAAGLAARFDEKLPGDGRDIDDILARIRSDVIAESNHLFPPRYLGHQLAGPLPAAVWTESVNAALNQSLAVFEMSPG